MATGATLVFIGGERPYALQELNYLAEDNPRYRKAG